jgi:hypothetical protein
MIRVDDCGCLFIGPKRRTEVLKGVKKGVLYTLSYIVAFPPFGANLNLNVARQNISCLPLNPNRKSRVFAI